jgi:hypothetical protein
MKGRRISNSPLMDPFVCALIIIDPAPRDLVAVDPMHIAAHQRATAALTEAAAIMNVPVFYLSRHIELERNPLAAPAPGITSHRRFTFEEHGSPWSQQAFVDALAGEDRSIVVLAGFWIEHQVLDTALHSLAEGYDVNVVLDASPCRCPFASQPAQDRLSQAGASPVISSQVIHEWTIGTPDAAKRVVLNALMSNLMQPA